MSSKKHYKIKKGPVTIAVILVLLLILLAVFVVAKLNDKKDNVNTGGDVSQGTSSDISSDPQTSDVSSESPSSTEETSSKEDALPEGSLSDWNLILLNPEPENKIDSELNFEKTKFDSQWVDSRAGVYYQKMYDAAKKDGITLFLRSGYRSIATQKVNYNANVQREIKRGNSQEEAIRLTNLYYTVPGHSEHHSGLAFDLLTPEYHKTIYSLDERFAQTDAYTWLTEHADEFGFVLRYPKDKESITTINFEPWHYRYVGVEHAKYMKEHNLCLEEYIKLLKDAGR